MKPLNIDDLLDNEWTQTIGGTEYKFHALVARHWAKVYTRLKRDQPDPIAIARELALGLPSEERKEIFKQAYADAIKTREPSTDTVQVWRESVPGQYYQFHLALSDNHPDLSEADTAAIMDRLGLETEAAMIVKIQERYPEASAEEIRSVMAGDASTFVLSVISKLSGMPEGNLASPTQTTMETTPSPGVGGSVS